MIQALLRRGRSVANRLRPASLVLCYHRVSDDTADHWQNAVSVRNFEDQVAFLARHYEVISIGQLADALIAGRPTSRHTAVITFDDGYAVNSTHACDILLRHRAPATFYMNTAWLDRERFWWDELVDLLDGAGEATTIERHRTRFKLMDDEARELELQALRVGRARRQGPDYAPATRADVRRLAGETLFTVGGHTHSHPSLGRVSRERQRFEITDNKRQLEELCGRPVTHFSYPFGGPSDFDDDTVSEVRAAAFQSAVTTTAVPQRWPGDPYRIPRLSVKNWDVRKFAAKLQELQSR